MFWFAALLAPSAFPQAVAYSNVSSTTNASCAPGALCNLMVIPGTQVNICGGTSVPYSACLSAPATTYTGFGAGAPCPTTAQLWNINAANPSCVSTTDNQGNLFFWALPGQYTYWLTLPTRITPAPGNQFGPYPINVGSSAGCVLGGTCDANFAVLSTADTSAGTGSLYITRNWNGLTNSTFGSQFTFLSNGKIQPASGQTLTFSKMPVCPVLQQCFDTSLAGPGSIRFPAPATASQVEWFGAVAQNTSGPLNGGAVNSAAFTAAQRAIPQWPVLNPNNVVMNMGTIKVADNGIAFGYPLASTFVLSPYTTFAGDDTATGYLLADRSSFTGTYLIDAINANGTGTSCNNNFNMGVRNFNMSTINPAATAVIGLIDWCASLNSKIANIYGNTSGIGINYGQTDGTKVEDVTINVSPVAGQSALTGQCVVVSNGNVQQETNVISRLKCVYAGAFGSGPLQPGFLPNSGNYMVELGPEVQGLTIDGLNVENAPSVMSVGLGSHDIFVKNVQAFQDCGTECTVQTGCAFLVEPNTYNIHLEGTVEGFRYAVCLGYRWMPSTAYASGQTFVIDPYGCIQQVTTSGTSGTGIQPAWTSGPSCDLTTTSDGSAGWTSRGAITTACDPSEFFTPTTFDSAGYVVNCAIPTVNRSQNVGHLTLTGPIGQSDLADNNGYGFIYDSNTFWNTPPAWSPGVIATLFNANFGTSIDQVITPHWPPSATKLVITAVYASGFSANLTTAQGGIWSGPGKTGCSIVPASQTWGTVATPAANLFVSANVAGGTCAVTGTSIAGNTYGTGAPGALNGGLYLHIDTPQAGSGSITVIGYPIK